MSKRIEVRDLNVYYGKFLAVEGVSLEIEPRSVTAFIGPSGCGKSTFLRTLNRMHEVIPGARVEGEVLIDGNNLYDPAVDPVLVRRQVGMVFQRPNPFPTMSIRDNVLAGVKLNNRRISKSDADDLVSDAFAKVIKVLQGGGGPDVAFRAYLLTAVRRLHVDKIRANSKLQSTDDMEAFDPGVPFRDTAVEGFESAAAAKAFASLPERWQAVL